MTYQLFIAIGLLVFAINLALNLVALKRPSSNGKLPGPVALVSVLIPARDEEANIENCLRSLQQQDYPNLEIIVLDDSSMDGTASIVESISTTDSRIQLLRGKPLSPGWAGKPFACYQLAKKAKGAWLLFVDADTVHAPHMVRSVLSLALEHECSLLSGFPHQITTSLPQRMAIPVLYFVILSWFPLWWLHRSKKCRPSLAIGQFLLFSREGYWRIGGHRAVKSRLLEDVWLGVEVSRHGGRHMAVDLSAVVSCNMYRNARSMWEGFVRWPYSVAAVSSLAVLGLLIGGFVFFLAPFYWLWQAIWGATPSSGLRFLIVSQISLMMVMRWVVDRRFNTPVVSTLLHPLGFSFLFAACVYGASAHVFGARVRWKKRLYGGESGVE